MATTRQHSYLVLRLTTSLACLLIFLSSFSLLIGIARAEESTISVNPAIVEIPALSGKNYRKSIRVTNGSNQAMPMSFELQEAVLEGEPLGTYSKERYDISEWISLEDETVLFKKNETKNIFFEVNIPEDALAGGHYGFISIRGLSLEQSLEGQATSLVFPEVNIPIFITVDGEIIESARFSTDKLFPNTATPSSTISTKVPIENTGTVHNLLGGTIRVEKDGELYEEIKIKPSVLLPSSRKYFEVDWSAPSEYGKYELNVISSVGSSGDELETMQQTLYVLPAIWKLIVLAIVTWISAYIYTHRNRLGKAWRAFKK